MRALLSYTRSTFWVFGVVGIFFGLTMAVLALLKGGTFPLAFLFALVNIALGTVFCFAANGLRRQTRASRPLVAITSLISLALFPFGTIAGAVGLYWCFSPKMREVEPAAETFDFQSQPGDGTHRWVQKAVPFLSFVIWIITFVCASKWGKAHRLPVDGAVNGWILIFGCDWLSAFLHELGHAIAAWASEMTLASFTVGPFVAQKRAGKWQFQFSLAAMVSLGGSVSSTPLHLNDLRRRMAFEIAGGPVASLLTALIAFWILLSVPGSGWEVWWKVPAYVAALAGGAVVLNLIPFGSAAAYSDGALLVQLLWGGPFADLRAAMKMVGVTLSTSVRPRDLDAQALRHGLRAGVGTADEGILQMIEMICAVDRGELTFARECLEAGLQKISTPEKARSAAGAAEMAFYLTYLDGNALRGRPWLQGAESFAEKAKTPLIDDFDYWLAVTAIREAEGIAEEAEHAWRRAKMLVDQKPVVGIYEYERDLLEKVRTADWLRPPALPANESFMDAYQEARSATAG